jgi:hypothetical protein
MSGLLSLICIRRPDEWAARSAIVDHHRQHCRIAPCDRSHSAQIGRERMRNVPAQV